MNATNRYETANECTIEFISRPWNQMVRPRVLFPGGPLVFRSHSADRRVRIRTMFSLLVEWEFCYISRNHRLCMCYMRAYVMHVSLLFGWHFSDITDVSITGHGTGPTIAHPLNSFSRRAVRRQRYINSRELNLGEKCRSELSK